MAVNEADILNELDAQNIGKSVDNVYRDFITDIGNELQEAFRKYTNDHTKGSGTLAQSFVAKPEKNGFVINADFYYNFIDLGVQASPLPPGIKPTRKQFTGNSPYAFESLFVPERMERSIAQWTGKPIGANYGVAVSIKKHGIEPKNITSNVITDEVLQRIADDLSQITGIAVSAMFERTEKAVK